MRWSVHAAERGTGGTFDIVGSMDTRGVISGLVYMRTAFLRIEGTTSTFGTNPISLCPILGLVITPAERAVITSASGMLVVGLLCLLPCALAAPTFAKRGGHAIQHSESNNVHITSHMTRAERDEAIRKLQSAYNASTIGDLRNDCNNCINAQQGSIDAHAVRADDHITPRHP